MSACTPDSNQFSPKEMVNKVLTTEKETNVAYYGESTTVTKENETEVERFVMKEWRDGTGKIRVEIEGNKEEPISIAVNDGASLISYEPKQKQALIMDDQEMLALNQPSPMDQVNFILEQISKTHEIRTGKEQKIAGRQTQLVIAEPKAKDQLYGRQELWIDKENWIVLKMNATIGNQTVETEYNQINFEADIADEKYSLKLPKDVEVKNMNELNSNRKVTLEEAREQMGSTFLYVPEAEDIVLSNVELIELAGEFSRMEVSMDYTKNNIPIFNLSVFPIPNEDNNDIETFTASNEKRITFRGVDGVYTEDDTYQMLLWDEQGLRYSIMIMDADLSLNQIKQFVNKMKFVP
ncbi:MULTISPECIES: sigma-E factor regulatory protein RseB domain-containing protein [Virgibacillus]|uniref:LolA family protein n=1 Tax=Virgibacillus TaxID=84406 RepID=UPI00159238C6|nr:MULTISPECIES: sigma-E factor regulatory protein RseB domain-containing protein [Virgibacillus]NWO14223.1 outer membrane lipoprotein carrier protein LolA [Virgibacillus sp.]